MKIFGSCDPGISHCECRWLHSLRVLSWVRIGEWINVSSKYRSLWLGFWITFNHLGINGLRIRLFPSSVIYIKVTRRLDQPAGEEYAYYFYIEQEKALSLLASTSKEWNKTAVHWCRSPVPGALSSSICLLKKKSSGLLIHSHKLSAKK